MRLVMKGDKIVAYSVGIDGRDDGGLVSGSSSRQVEESADVSFALSVPSTGFSFLLAFVNLWILRLALKRPFAVLESGIELQGGKLPDLGEMASCLPRRSRRAFIDFDIEPPAVAREDPMSFTAIRPIGPHYEFRDDDSVKLLRECSLKSMQATHGP